MKIETLKSNYLNDRINLKPIDFVNYINDIENLTSKNTFKTFFKWLTWVENCESHIKRKRTKLEYLTWNLKN
jgi:hypothetical protein